MKRDFLKSLGIEDKEIIDKIMDENGKDINQLKADNQTLKDQLQTANDTIKDRNKQLEKLKEIDVEDLKSQIDILTKQNKEDAKKYQDSLKEINLNNAIKLALNEKVHDIDMTLGQIDKSKLVILENGKVAGLEEQITSLKESKGFLFKTGEVKTEYKPVGGGVPIVKNPFSKEHFNLTEQGKIFKENPTKAREMAAEAGVEL